MAKYVFLGCALVVGAFVLVQLVRSNPRHPQFDEEQHRRFFAAQNDEPPASPVIQEQALPKPADFDGKRAMTYLEAICAIGPRMSGTEGMKKQQELLRKHFEKLGLQVKMQTFEAKQKSRPRPVNMANMIISFAPDRPRRAIICSHYDTRPLADQEPNRNNWDKPFVSANDGGSGAALAMELAHHLKDLKLEVGVDLVLFDGEEYVFGQGDDYFFGSLHFADAWVKDKQRPTCLGAVLLDMIAGKNVTIPQEWHSRKYAGNLVDEIFGLARALDCNVFRNANGDQVMDDHLPLQEVGIPAIDLIDFRYPHWHRLSDTPENCSPEGMIQVAKVLSVWLQRLK